MNKKPVLTNTFFQFVIGFSAILLVSFGLLIFLGLESERQNTITSPTPSSSDSATR